MKDLKLWKSSLSSTVVCLFQSLSDEIRIQVKRKYVSRRLGDRLLDHIHSEIDTREMSQKIKITAEQVKGPSFPATDSRNFFGAFQTESTVPKCVYCTERHFSASCSKVTDINARKDILRRDKRCFMCLKKGHLVDQCNKSCRNCK